MVWIISAIIWFVIAYAMDFSVLGWIIGLVASFVFEQFIFPVLIANSQNKDL